MFTSFQSFFSSEGDPLMCFLVGQIFPVFKVGFNKFAQLQHFKYELTYI